MLWFKLRFGLLRVVAGSETRVVKLSPAERLRLLWMFRNFHSLPHQVLSTRQRRLVDRLCADSEPKREQRGRAEPAYLIGTVERPAGIPKKPSARETLGTQGLRYAVGLSHCVPPQICPIPMRLRTPHRGKIRPRASSGERKRTALLP